ncbi:MAG: hypothetical protein ACE5GM_06900 [bacterium]
MAILYRVLTYYFWSYIKTPLFYFILTHFIALLLEASLLKPYLQDRNSPCLTCQVKVKKLKKRCRVCDQPAFDRIKNEFIKEKRYFLQWRYLVEAPLLVMSFFVLKGMWGMRWSRYDAYGMIIATIYFYRVAKPLAYYLIFRRHSS